MRKPGSGPLCLLSYPLTGRRPRTASPSLTQPSLQHLANTGQWSTDVTGRAPEKGIYLETQRLSQLLLSQSVFRCSPKTPRLPTEPHFRPAFSTYSCHWVCRHAPLHAALEKPRRTTCSSDSLFTWVSKRLEGGRHALSQLPLHRATFRTLFTSLG